MIFLPQPSGFLGIPILGLLTSHVFLIKQILQYYLYQHEKRKQLEQLVKQGQKLLMWIKNNLSRAISVKIKLADKQITIKQKFSRISELGLTKRLNQNFFKCRLKYFYQNMNEEYSFSKLAEIKKKLPRNQQEFSTIGIIIDSTNPYRKDSKKDFCMKLKIIDPSSAGDPCHVFLFSRSKEDFPQKIHVGDLLMLHKYGFDIWNDSLQAKKHFKVMGAEFRFFSGNPASDTYSFLDGQSSTIDDFDGSALSLIKALRKFSQTYFKKNNVPVYAKSGKKSSDFDLLLEVEECEKLETEGFKVKMSNSVNNFEMNYCYELEPGVYKLRSIADISQNAKKHILIGNDYTCFLRIPSWMKSYDSKYWEKLAKAKSSETKTERQKLETKILNEIRGERRKVIELKSLMNRDQHNEEVAVVCEFVECFTAFSSALRRYDSFNNTEKRFDHEQGQYIYNIHYVITDESLQGELFNVYLYTYDGQGIEFLPGLDPDKIYGRNLLNYQEKYDHMNNRLLEETDIQKCPLKIILSPMFNGKETIYRIVDTQLLL